MGLKEKFGKGACGGREQALKESLEGGRGGEET